MGQKSEEVEPLCRRCGRESETPAHVLGICPFNQLLITRRHHKVKKTLATLLEERGFTCLDEVYCIDSDGSPRFADIVAINKSKKVAYIVDPTVRFDPVKVDLEKRSIYEKCIPYLNEKLKDEFGNKHYVVRGLWFGSRGAVPPLTTSFFDEVGLDSKKLQDIAESIIIDSLGIIHHHHRDIVLKTDWEVRQEQIKDFYEIFQGIDKSIPLICVCGNHDVGDQPTVESVSRYRSTFGDDFFSFWAGGIFFIVINSQYYYDGSKVPEITAEQEKWLDEQLKFSSQSKHGAVIFQHIPWFLDDPQTNTESYFFIKKKIRLPMLEKLYNNGVRYVFCGHYHRNAGGFYKDLELVVTSAIGGQLGNEESGFRIVKVLDQKISHEYYGFNDCPNVINLKGSN